MKTISKFIMLLPSHIACPILILTTITFCGSVEVPAEKKLIERLSKAYFWPVRPVSNFSDELFVLLRFSLIRINELNMKNQVLSLQILIEQEWTDNKLKWNPDNYNGIKQIVLPIDDLWLPDLQLYNSFGPFQLQSKYVMVHWNGVVKWDPLGEIKNFCPIEMRYYPFDIQCCTLAFGSWSYSGNHIWFALKDLPVEQQKSMKSKLRIGMDLSYFNPSSEWDILSISAESTVMRYTGSKEKFIRIQFPLTLRRHPHFYLLNLVCPLAALSYLSIAAFYLPADSGEKIVLTVSLITSQVTFLFLMMDNIPVTSLAVPLLGKVIIFNMLLAFCSILCTTVVLNVHHRKPTTHQLPNWVKNLRLNRILTKLIFMETGALKQSKVFAEETYSGRTSKEDAVRLCSESAKELLHARESMNYWRVRRAFANIHFIRVYIQHQEEMAREQEHWKFLASVMDRIFLITFNCVYFVIMSIILMDAPALFNHAKAIDKHSSMFGQPTATND